MQARSFTLLFGLTELKTMQVAALVGRSEEKKPLGIPKCRWEDNINNILQYVRWGGKDWIDLAQERDRQQAHKNVVIKLPVV
jgi:hypothetical protein